MNKEQLQALGITAEQADKVLEAYKGWVPSTRFNEVNEAKKQAEAQIKERDTQLADLKKGLDGKDELTAKIEALQAENKAALEKYEHDLKSYKISNAIELALAQHGAKNLKAVKALIDVEKIKVDGEKVEGIEDQITALIKGADTSFLFESKQPEAQAPKGMKAGDSGGNHGNEPPKAMTLADAIAQRFNEGSK